MADLKKNHPARVVVVRMGTIERVDGYAVFINGRETQPWHPIRDARKLARDFTNALGLKPRTAIPVLKNGGAL